MYDTTPDDPRTGHESSPSTGYREIAAIMHAPGAHAAEADPDARDADTLEDADTMHGETSTTPEVAI